MSAQREAFAAVMKAPQRRPAFILASGPVLTRHAMERIHELRVDISQVRDTYQNPEQIWASSFGGYNLVGPEILLAIDAIGGTVLTVKLRCRTAYQHGVHTVLNRPR